MENKYAIPLFFAATEKVLESSIPSFKEIDARGKNYVYWGESNEIPNYLYDLFTTTTTLRSVINGTSDFVSGDDVIVNVKGFDTEINKKGDTAFELVNDIARDLLLYGNAFVQIIRNKAGGIGELYYLNAKYVRCSKKNDLFWYSEDFGKRYSRSNKTVVYPKFVKEATDIAASVMMIKSENDKTYGLPQYIASLKDCEVERMLSEFNLSQLENGFFPSYLINFANGIPDDSLKAEIERNMTEKFTSPSNAGRFILNFSDGKDNGVTMQKMDIDNYSEKYESTADRASKKIYEAFGASPVLFGVEKETTGFNSEDYEQAFKLYNRIRIRPIQKKIVTMFDKVFGTKGSVEIKPFTIDWGETKTSDDKVNNAEKTVE